MNRLSRNLWWDRHSHVIIGILAGGSLLALGAQAYFLEDSFSVLALTFFGVLWVLFAVLNGRSWRRTLRSWQQTLDCWGETSALVSDLTSLLDESLADLSTYDRDKAIDIAARSTTVMKMRSQNIDRKIYEKEDS